MGYVFVGSIYIQVTTKARRIGKTAEQECIKREKKKAWGQELESSDI